MTVKELRQLLFQFDDDSVVKGCYACESVEEASEINVVTTLRYHTIEDENEVVVIRME
jgi:hypothetical protein